MRVCYRKKTSRDSVPFFTLKKKEKGISGGEGFQVSPIIVGRCKLLSVCLLGKRGEY